MLVAQNFGYQSLSLRNYSLLAGVIPKRRELQKTRHKCIGPLNKDMLMEEIPNVIKIHVTNIPLYTINITAAH